MDFDNGLDSEEEFEIDCALVTGSEAEIHFATPLVERIDDPQRRKSRRKQRRDENRPTSDSSEW